MSESQASVQRAPVHKAPVHMFLAGALPAGVEGVLERLARTEGVAHIAVMPDVHLAGEFCVGTVVASAEMLFPNAVGGDIGCGMLALKFDGNAGGLRDAKRAGRLLGALVEHCPARRHHRKMAHGVPAAIRERPFSHPVLESLKLSEGLRLQLGTLGAGNHFLELQRDESDDGLWLMVHTGSRHLGQAVLQHHLPKARRLESGIFAIGADGPSGRAYLEDVEIARTWARENRRLLAMGATRAVEAVLHVTPLLESLYDCDHNHVQRERVGEAGPFFVHRKGATAAGVGEVGLVPGSMGTRSFHTKGLGNGLSLGSSSHGAGRALSRLQARTYIKRSVFRQQMRNVWYDGRMESHLLEEAPGAYKDIDGVMAAPAVANNGGTITTADVDS